MLQRGVEVTSLDVSFVDVKDSFTEVDASFVGVYQKHTSFLTSSIAGWCCLGWPPRRPRTQGVRMAPQDLHTTGVSKNHPALSGGIGLWLHHCSGARHLLGFIRCSPWPIPRTF